MEIQAVSKSVRMSPRKVRLVAEAIKNLSVDQAQVALTLIRKRAAKPLRVTLASAVANAMNNAKLDRESLYIKKIDVLEGSAFKRFHPSTRGRVHPYKKRSTNITVVLGERGEK